MIYSRGKWTSLTLRSLVAIGLAILLSAPRSANAAMLWSWHYSTEGISADGSFTTDDVPDGAGFYRITGITGSRNGVAIVGLQATGTPILGNEPFAVDNRIRANRPQLTGHGVGFALADGTYANAFFADGQTPQIYLEFFSAPPFAPGVIGREDSELPVTFRATVGTSHSGIGVTPRAARLQPARPPKSWPTPSRRS